MANSNLVSVLTPAYNHEAFIGPCIESVLSQTHTEWEQIIIDDGSTDRTRDIVGRYQDSRIRYYKQENRGLENLAATYNRGVGYCRGDFVAVLEGDDIWPAEKLASMVGAFADSSVVLAYGEMREIDVQGNVAPRGGATARKLRKLPTSVLCNDPIGAAVPYMLTVVGHSMIPASTVIIRKSALEAIGGFQHVPGQLCVDFPTFIQLALQGKFSYVPGIMGYRRMHIRSATAQFFEEMTERSHRHLLDLLARPEFRLSGEELAKVLRSWGSVGAGSSYRRGRGLLMRREWRAARACFARALRGADALVAMGAIAGWCLSWVHMDLENVYRYAGRPTMRSEQ